MTPTPAGGERPMRADARRNYQRLLQAASAAFAEHGADASLDDIARRAGVGSGTLYRHFPNRQALLETVYRDEIETLASQAHQLQETMAPLDAMITWLQAVAKHITTYRGLRELLAAALSDQQSQLYAWCHDSMLSAATSILDRAQQSGLVRPDIDAYQMLRLINAIVLTNEQAHASTHHAQQLLMLAIDGMRHQQPPPK
jgi:AcrR family transcriptional regulator